MTGGLWKRAPVSWSKARVIAASPPGSAWKRTTQTYSFPATSMAKTKK
eukprot:CAMPEP_0185915644 /NCGR_PEP_ID=MMETSP0924C-20121207/2627_1 /TAXON_ID=321610 /ORGANISM="Perkinsus chesapeaki, Strain ATCC PRA-65" /LENGTH=47 /DNA_ID= /DNA_START= /DNA_END= /DNA_ORIENTATION=